LTVLTNNNNSTIVTVIIATISWKSKLEEHRDKWAGRSQNVYRQCSRYQWTDIPGSYGGQARLQRCFK